MKTIDQMSETMTTGESVKKGVVEVRYRLYIKKLEDVKNSKSFRQTVRFKPVDRKGLEVVTVK